MFADAVVGVAKRDASMIIQIALGIVLAVLILAFLPEIIAFGIAGCDFPRVERRAIVRSNARS